MEDKIKTIKGKDVNVNYIDKKIEMSKEEQKKIDAYWDSVSHIFHRGTVFVVDSINETENALNIDISNSDYAHYIYVRRNPGKARDCYNLWAGVVLETTDKKYVIGKMSETTSSAGEYHISGGSCDKNDFENGKLNYEKTMYRELEEEMGLKKSDLKDVEMKYMKNAFLTEQDIGIIYKAVVKMTSAEVEEHYHQYLEKLKRENGEIEYDELAYIDKEKNAINDFCLASKTPEYTRQLLLEDVSEK